MAAPDQQLACEQRGEREQDRDHRQPRDRRLAARHLQPGVDCQRQGARLARDVAGESDRRAELAERAREAEHGPGQHAGQAERQGNGQEGAPRRRAERARGADQPPVDCLDRQPHRAHHQRQRHDRRGERGAGPAKDEDQAESLFEESPDRPAPPEGEEQQPAGHHRRHDQRQVDQRVEQQAPGKAPPREQPGERVGDRQRRRHRDQADLEREDDDGPLGGARPGGHGAITGR